MLKKNSAQMGRESVSRFLLGNVTLTILTGDLSGFYMHNSPNGPPLLTGCWWGGWFVRRNMNKGQEQVYLTERKISTLSAAGCFCFYYYLLGTESSPNKNPLLVISSISIQAYYVQQYSKYFSTGRRVMCCTKYKVDIFSPKDVLKASK